MTPREEVSISSQVRVLPHGGLFKGSLYTMNDENAECFDNVVGHVSYGKPPRDLSVMRHCSSTTWLATAAELDFDNGIIGIKSPSNEPSGILPVLFRSGSCSDIGPKLYMEDEFVCIDNLCKHLGCDVNIPSPAAFYEVFDGHGGTDASSFTKKNILNFVVEDSHFPTNIAKAVNSAFAVADHVFAGATSLDKTSGTTALTALILERLDS